MRTPRPRAGYASRRRTAPNEQKHRYYNDYNISQEHEHYSTQILPITDITDYIPILQLHETYNTQILQLITNSYKSQHN